MTRHAPRPHLWGADTGLEEGSVWKGHPIPTPRRPGGNEVAAARGLTKDSLSNLSVRVV